MARNVDGFTLTELMVVVAIIGILAGIALPKAQEAVRRAREATTKGNLSTLRESICAYYADQGHYPTDNLTSLVPTYLSGIPKADTVVWHHAGNAVHASTAQDDPGTADQFEWWYDNVTGDPLFGEVRVNCNHSDIKGVSWLAY